MCNNLLHSMGCMCHVSDSLRGNIISGWGYQADINSLKATMPEKDKEIEELANKLFEAYEIINTLNNSTSNIKKIFTGLDTEWYEKEKEKRLSKRLLELSEKFKHGVTPEAKEEVIKLLNLLTDNN